jgi:ubiquinone/menaquinone biosynthesis C-methylase UbiE
VQDSFDIKLTKNARIRLRYVIPIDNWRFDITIVKNIANMFNPSEIKDTKNTILYPISVDNFIESAPWDKSDLIEFELEYVGDNFQLPDLNIINSIDDIINKSLNKSPSKSPIKSPSINSPKSEADENKVDENYQKIIYEIAKYIKPEQANRFLDKDGLKQLSNQVIELNKVIYMNLVAEQITNFYITDKIDGKRAIVYINGDSCYAITNEIQSLDISTDNIYIFDTEYYNDAYYIFDVMVWKGTVITNQEFYKRLVYFENAEKISPLFKTKPFIKLDNSYKEIITNFKKVEKLYEIDGIILTPSDGLYTSMKVYKYKPVEKLTVDFLIKKCPDKLIGISPYVKNNSNLYILCCAISRNVYETLKMKLIKFYDDMFPNINVRKLPDYFAIQFQTSNNSHSYLYWDDKDLDGEIGEFRYYEGKWHLEKIREDRKIELARGNYFGNNYKIAELIWMSYDAPLIIEEFKHDMYFQKSDNPLQKASRNFNSFVKASVFEKHSETEWVMDIASGKGQDLFRYGNYGMQHVTFLEIDNTALLELITRKHDFSQNRDRNRMAIYAQQIDINQNYHGNIEKLQNIELKEQQMDLVMCNFAFHYFAENRTSILNVIKFIKYYVKLGGRFVFTAFDGKAIFNLLNKNNGEWTVRNNGDIQYSIKSAYTEKSLEKYGQEIEVLLPFSKKDYYKEYLINADYIQAEFEKNGFVMEINESFGEYLDDYKNKNYNNFSHMSSDDKLYAGLYHVYIFYKKQEKTGGRRK